MDDVIAKVLTLLNIIVFNKPFFEIDTSDFYKIITPNVLMYTSLTLGCLYVCIKRGSPWTGLTVALYSVAMLTILTYERRAHEVGIEIIFLLIYVYRAFDGICLVYSLNALDTKKKLYCFALTSAYLFWLLNSEFHYTVASYGSAYLALHIATFYCSAIGAYTICNHFFRHDHFGPLAVFITHLISVFSIFLSQSHMYQLLMQQQRESVLSNIPYEIIFPVALGLAAFLRLFYWCFYSNKS